MSNTYFWAKVLAMITTGAKRESGHRRSVNVAEEHQISEEWSGSIVELLDDNWLVENMSRW